MSIGEREGGRGAQQDAARAEPNAAGHPGKTTLTENVQRRVQPLGAQAVSEAPAAVQATAAQGTSGPGGALPHLDQIQQSFGRFDLGGVRAHTDGAASQATGAMGAEAYASGNDIAFSGQPSLHTAAHEAAHVVQQQGGVQLKGGVGEAGDSYEQHADAVADRVVAGQSAEGLLGEMAGGAGGGSAGLQLKLAKTQSGINGAKGLRDIFKDDADNKLYAKMASSTATVFQLIEVTVAGAPGAERYTEVVGATKKALTVATMDWVDPSAPAQAPAPVVPTGWTLSQITGAHFAKHSGNHYQRNEAAFLGYHVHVSAYQEANKEFTSFHVKFDPGALPKKCKALHLSWFYAFSLGGKYDHAGQSLADQKELIKVFAEKDGDAASAKKVDEIYDSLVDESETIAAAVRGDLV